MSKEVETNKIKICRQCHTIYKSFSQPYCGDGCEKKPPFLVDGHPVTEIENREIIVTKNSENQIKWLCLHCHHEYNFDEVKGKNWKCPDCQTINDVFAFTSKWCQNCKESDGGNHPLLLNAKACDLCGKSDFIINGSQIVSELKKRGSNSESVIKSTENISDSGWIDNTDLQLAETKGPIPQTNLPSITFTILNNNCEYIFYGEGKRITVENILHNAQGYMPDVYYEYLLTNYPDYLFEIEYKEEKFYFQSKMDVKFAELNSQFKQTSEYKKWDSEVHNPLPESKLLNFIGDKLKFRIWVY